MPSGRTERYRAACAQLGVPETATPEEIREAYRDLVQIWHPDRLRGERLQSKAEEQLRRINEAYSIVKARPDRDDRVPPPTNAQRASFRRTWPRAATSDFRLTRTIAGKPTGRVIVLVVPFAMLMIFATMVRHLITNPAELTVSVLNSALGRGPAGLHPSSVLSPWDDVLTGIESLATWASIQSEPSQPPGPVDIPPPKTVGKRLRSISRSQRIEYEPASDADGAGVLRIENASGQMARLELLDNGGNQLYRLTLESDSTAVFRAIRCGRYFLIAKVGDRIRHIGPFDFMCIQDSGGVRSVEHRYVLR
jgi:hypothetical protein